MAKQQKSPERKLAESIAKEKGIKIKSAFRYLQRAKATGTKQKIKNPKFSGISEKVAKKAKTYVKKEKKKAEAPKATKEIKKPIKYVEPEDDFDYIDNPLYGEDVDEGRNAVEVDGDFGYYGGQRKMTLYLSAAEMRELANAETQEDAINIWAGSKDGSFMSSPEITNIRSMRKK